MSQVVADHLAWSGHRTWYEVRGAGDAPALVLLPGGPGGSGRYLTPLAERLAGPRRVVLYDPLGTARSDREPPSAGWTLELFLEELRALRTALALGRVVLLGHSWGGWLALEHVLRGASGVRGLALYSSSASARRTAEEMQPLVEALPAEGA